MRAAGLAAFERRDPSKTKRYTFEREPDTLTPEQVTRFKSLPGAWEFLEAQPPGYRRLAIGWIAHAKLEDARERRLVKIIDHCARGQRYRW